MVVHLQTRLIVKAIISIAGEFIPEEIRTKIKMLDTQTDIQKKQRLIPLGRVDILLLTNS